MKTKKKYLENGARMAVLSTKMDLLGITDVSTPRQEKNGTVVWRLPIKNNWTNGKLIEVASFKTGYVRNQNSGYSNYQLNKRCESEPEYYKTDKKDHCGRSLYNVYTTRTCKLIPNEIDRLEYLISYCLKNYFIKRANEVADGKYVSKWYHEYELERNQNKMEEICHVDANHAFVVSELKCKVKELEDKLVAIHWHVQRIADHE
tara:strand:+ start:47 stop:658 length:612 start_codon:yes stop_codon:yes gene_type:complete